VTGRPMFFRPGACSKVGEKIGGGEKEGGGGEERYILNKNWGLGIVREKKGGEGTVPKRAEEPTGGGRWKSSKKRSWEKTKHRRV